VIRIKQPPVRRQCLALLIATACSAQVTAQQSIQPFAKWASNRVVPLDTVEPSHDVSDLRLLRSLIGSAKVVAIGEPGHGNHEPLSFRNRLFAFLVAEMGFTAIAIESGLSESERVQAFVAGGPGIASQITRDNLTYGFGNFQENVDLVRWIHDYNSDPSHRRKVRFYGIDISLGGPRTATPAPVAVETALSYVARIDGEAAGRLRERLQPFLDRLRVTNPESFSEADRDLMTAAIGDLTALLEAQRQTFVARTSKGEYEWALRNAISAQQADRVFRLMPPPSTGGVPPTAWRQMTARDEALAENVRWILEREGPSGRVLVFAHSPSREVLFVDAKRRKTRSSLQEDLLRDMVGVVLDHRAGDRIVERETPFCGIGLGHLQHNFRPDRSLRRLRGRCHGEREGNDRDDAGQEAAITDGWHRRLLRQQEFPAVLRARLSAENAFRPTVSVSVDRRRPERRPSQNKIEQSVEFWGHQSTS